MTEIICKISLNDSEKKILIDGLVEGGDFEIDYSGDIDFTPLVSKLTELIDLEKKIECPASSIMEGDEKTELIVDTVRKIFKKYNEVVVDKSEGQDIGGDSTETNDNDEDLPF